MEPRARAGKNVGKQNFSHSELAQTLYGHGDVGQPLTETVRVLDEIATDFIQSVSFEAARTAQHAGRQKVKIEDFHFAMRRNPSYMGRIQEVFEKKKEIDAMRKNFSTDEVQFAKEEDKEERDKERNEGGAASSAGGAGGERSKKRARLEEELGEGDDDLSADADIGTTHKKRR